MSVRRIVKSACLVGAILAALLLVTSGCAKSTTEDARQAAAEQVAAGTATSGHGAGSNVFDWTEAKDDPSIEDALARANSRIQLPDKAIVGLPVRVQLIDDGPSSERSNVGVAVRYDSGIDLFVMPGWTDERLIEVANASKARSESSSSGAGADAVSISTDHGRPIVISPAGTSKSAVYGEIKYPARVGVVEEGLHYYFKSSSVQQNVLVRAAQSVRR